MARNHGRLVEFERPPFGAWGRGRLDSGPAIYLHELTLVSLLDRYADELPEWHLTFVTGRVLGKVEWVGDADDENEAMASGILDPSGSLLRSYPQPPLLPARSLIVPTSTEFLGALGRIPKATWFEPIYRSAVDRNAAAEQCRGRVLKIVATLDADLQLEVEAHSFMVPAIVGQTLGPAGDAIRSFLIAVAIRAAVALLVRGRLSAWEWDALYGPFTAELDVSRHT